MSRKKKDTEGFWKQYFRRFDMVITQHGGRDVEHRVSTSRFIISLYVLALAVVVAAITVVLLFYSPLKALMPGYVNPQVRRQIIESSFRIDSLYDVVMRQNSYVTNLQDILRGDIKINSINTIDSLTVLRSADLMERTERETNFVQQYEKDEKYNLTSQSIHKSEMGHLHFTPPLRGVIVTSFAPSELNYGIDITSTSGTNVNAILDGTVLMSKYTAGDGYVVIIQHLNNLTSIYKHLTSALQHEGETVKAGEPIGIIEQPKQQGQQYLPLHFELWHKGTALNPEQYISF